MEDYPAMNPLSVRIPLEYADALGVDRTLLAHVNGGRRHLSALSAIKLLDQAKDDPRLKDLTIFMLRPEAMAYQNYFLKAHRKASQRLRRKYKVTNCPIFKSVTL